MEREHDGHRDAFNAQEANEEPEHAHARPQLSLAHVAMEDTTAEVRAATETALSIFLESERTLTMELAQIRAFRLHLGQLPSSAQVQHYDILQAIDTSHERECPICHNPYNDKDHPAIRLRHVPCTHVFGRDCLQTWISSGQFMSHSCPSCRQSLTGALQAEERSHEVHRITQHAIVGSGEEVDVHPHRAVQSVSQGYLSAIETITISELVHLGQVRRGVIEIMSPVMQRPEQGSAVAQTLEHLDGTDGPQSETPRSTRLRELWHELDQRHAHRLQELFRPGKECLVAQLEIARLFPRTVRSVSLLAIWPCEYVQDSEWLENRKVAYIILDTSSGPLVGAG